jgi:hypothetical protein
MADQEWIKNLANAKFIDGTWETANPEAVTKLAADRIEDTIIEIYEEAAEAADVFNLHAVDRPAIRILPIARDKSAGEGGLIMLLGRIQLNLEIIKNKLEARITTVDGYHRSTNLLASLHPHADPFGSVMWIADKSSLMTNEIIIKRLLEQLVKSAFESGEIK